ncbi:hypothetical protein [Nocardioides sp. KR10-350]|uniref:hypothetical protein n=1 Tax=Nocardioides cheoyonin TaxID=3156615 RepID=UPI0032B57D7D
MKPQAERAPIKGKGGIMSPYVECTNANIEPHVDWTIRNNKTGATKRFSWTGAYPGMYFPRVVPGAYTSKTTVTCGKQTTVRTHHLVVRRKTYKTTMSWGEFRRIKRGMTRTKVRQIVGYPGRDSWAYNGTRTVTYDIMKFWCWTNIDYRQGRVVAKYWNVGHD